MTNEQMLAKYESDLRTIRAGGSVENLTEEGAIAMISGLRAVLGRTHAPQAQEGPARNPVADCDYDGLDEYQELARKGLAHLRPTCCGHPMTWVPSHDDYQCSACKCFHSPHGG